MGRRERRAGKKKQSLLDDISRKFKSAFADRRFEEALHHALQASRVAPGMAVAHTDAAVCLSRLGRWEEAIDQANLAARLAPLSLTTLDALSEAHGELGNWEEVRKSGLKALEARLQQFGGPALLPLQASALPPAPSPETRQHNLIAFSLFGGLSKYCETAVLNASERERLYPDWTCRFYVDESVPAGVLRRLGDLGAQVVPVGEPARSWPGPMWRFLVCDEPDLHRAIFRDADSVISEREVLAVAEWVQSDARFHHMRDACSHTELLLAGMWGCVGGALPSVRLLVQRFLDNPLVSQHFADQYFLREFVWPYARESLLQHDSLFGFLDARQFPDGPHRGDFHVGCAEGATRIVIEISEPDGTLVNWAPYETDSESKPVCSYSAVVKGGRIVVELPKRIANALAAGELLVHIDIAES